MHIMVSIFGVSKVIYMYQTCTASNITSNMQGFLCWDIHAGLVRIFHTMLQHFRGHIIILLTAIPTFTVKAM